MFGIHSFDCVYVLNLDHRTDRLLNITNQFEQINLKFVRFPAIKDKVGRDGCRFSHIAMLQDAKSKGYKNILICEDDLLIRKKLVEDMPKIVEKSQGCDMLYFHHHNFTIKSNEIVVRHSTPWCTHMYAVFNIDKVLDWTLKNNIHNKAIDNIYVNSRFNTFVTTEEYAFQNSNQSDITKEWEANFGRVLKYDDLLIEKHKLSNAYKKYFDVTNPIFLLNQLHSGMGDVLLFLSKVVEVAKYYKNKVIKLTTKNVKRDLMKEVIPLIGDDVTFEFTDEEPNIDYIWDDFGSVYHYFKTKPEFTWKENRLNCIAYQLNGCTWRRELKESPEDDIALFHMKMKPYVVIDMHKVFDFKTKVMFLLNCEQYYGVDSGNTHLAVALGVPTIIVRNDYVDPYLNVFQECQSIATVCDIRVVKRDSYNRFDTIYANNYWGNGSGPGSNPEVNTEYFAILSKILENEYIQTIVDIGCGDYQLMKDFKHTKRYVGCDASWYIVKQNRDNYPGIQFEHKIIVDEEPPCGEIALVKDVLQHMPNKDIFKLLQWMQKYKYALITNDFAENNGPDIEIGQWRPLNLRADPFRVNCKVMGNYNGKQIVLITN